MVNSGDTAWGLISTALVMLMTFPGLALFYGGLVRRKNVLGCGRQKGITQIYRGRKETGNLLKKVRLEIAVNEKFVEPTISAITKGAKTGNIGDGKIFVVDLAECVRIRTGERDGEAIG